MKINTISDFEKALENGPYAFPGGYPLFFICEDGGILSHQAATDEKELVISAIQDNDDPQWRVIYVDINYEDRHLYCDHTNQQIESAH